MSGFKGDVFTGVIIFVVLFFLLIFGSTKIEQLTNAPS